MSIGNRVFLKRPMPSQELLEGFAGLPAANIADTMGRSCAMNPRIRLMSGFQGIMAGPALTVKARAGDNHRFSIRPWIWPSGRRHRAVQ